MIQIYTLLTSSPVAQKPCLATKTPSAWGVRSGVHPEETVFQEVANAVQLRNLGRFGLELAPVPPTIGPKRPSESQGKRSHFRGDFRRNSPATGGTNRQQNISGFAQHPEFGLGGTVPFRSLNQFPRVLNDRIQMECHQASPNHFATQLRRPSLRRRRASPLHGIVQYPSDCSGISSDWYVAVAAPAAAAPSKQQPGASGKRQSKKSPQLITAAGTDTPQLSYVVAASSNLPSSPPCNTLSDLRSASVFR